MIRSLSLDNYRGFRHFELHDLGRVNLIVGTNNSGKTSILEAVNLLAAHGDVSALWRTLWRRGEDYVEEDAPTARCLDVRRLFNGHEIEIGKSFALTGDTDQTALSLSAEIVPRPTEDLTADEDFVPDDFAESGTGFDADQPSAFYIRWGQDSGTWGMADVMPGGGVALSSLQRALRRPEGHVRNVRFITAASLSPDTVIGLFEGVVLMPEEATVIKALKIIDSSIERIAPIATGRLHRFPQRTSSNRGGILVKCKDIDFPIPIGSMGEGIWRLLGLALSLVRTEGGILVIDEIDTGLHYSVMERMWKLVVETARDLDIQVFATTHSRDCYDSLAAVCNAEVSTNSDITIQRIERGKTHSVAYSEQEIIAAAENGLEVR